MVRGRRQARGTWPPWPTVSAGGSGGIRRAVASEPQPAREDGRSDQTRDLGLGAGLVWVALGTVGPTHGEDPVDPGDGDNSASTLAHCAIVIGAGSDAGCWNFWLEAIHTSSPVVVLKTKSDTFAPVEA